MIVVHTYLFVVCGGRGSAPAFVRCDRIGLPAQSEASRLSRPAYHARCLGYPRPSSGLSGVRRPGARDVWSMFARHRCHPLLSSGVETYRARCAASVRTSSLSSLVVLGVGPCRAQCVASVRKVIASSLAIVGDPTLFATTIAALCSRGLTSSLLSLAVVGGRTLLLFYRRMCGHRSHVIIDCHCLCLSGIGPFCYSSRD